MSTRAETVIVIAGGPSVTAEILGGLPAHPLVIGVNDAAFRAPRVDMCVTMDRLWTEARYADLAARKLPAFIRDSALQNIARPLFEQCHAFACDHKSDVMSDNLQTLNGGNSGACALNLAYIGKPRRIFLYGFDMKRIDGAAYWYEPYPWNPKGGTGDKRYAEWSRQFDVAAAQFREAGIEVYNVSPGSAIESFQKISPAIAREALAA